MTPGPPSSATMAFLRPRFAKVYTFVFAGLVGRVRTTDCWFFS